MNCEYCIYYEQCIKILKEKDEEIDLLKKKLHNTQRNKLRLKNKLNFKLLVLKEKLKEYEIEDDWDDITIENSIQENTQEKIKND